jgi:hypothetical protein
LQIWQTPATTAVSRLQLQRSMAAPIGLVCFEQVAAAVAEVVGDLVRFGEEAFVEAGGGPEVALELVDADLAGEVLLADLRDEEAGHMARVLSEQDGADDEAD